MGRSAHSWVTLWGYQKGDCGGQKRSRRKRFKLIREYQTQSQTQTQSQSETVAETL